jgi:hypothetical protein
MTSSKSPARCSSLPPSSRRWVDGFQQSSYTYLAVNAMGSAALTATAIVGREWGFLLLEGVWAAVSAYSLVRKSIGRPVAVSHS